MAFRHIFPEIYFSYPLPNHEATKQELLQQFTLDHSELVENWNCNTQRLNLPPGVILPAITPVLKSFGEEIGKAAKIFVDAAWMNFYEQGSFQEIHNHVGNGCQLALVYFVKYDQSNDGRFYFYNTNTEMVSSELTTLFNGPAGAFGSVVHPPISEGDVLIFPSHLHHGVSPHNRPEQRITISCNLRFQLKAAGARP